jgi:peptide/nickel transport system permease protein
MAYLKRALRMVLEILCGAFVIYTIVFFAVGIAPVDPARALVGPLAPESAVIVVREDFGLDKPLLIRYVLTLKQMLLGNFGTSIYFGKPALDVIMELAPITLGRSILALVIGCFIGAGLPLILARWRLFRVKLAFALLYSIPSFCVMLIILWIGARIVGVTPGGNLVIFEVLAVVGASLYPLGAIAGYMLAGLDFGKRRPRHVDFLLMLHAPRNVTLAIVWKELLPGAAAIAINVLPAVITAVTLAEYIFGLSGFGYLYIKSSERGDFPIVTAGAFLVGVILLAGQRFSDVIVRRLDTRWSNV